MACIFCGRRPLTKEHIWAGWLEQYLPREDESYSVLKAIAHGNRSEFKTEIRKGDVHTWQVRCVCASCNNEWMSRLQVDAKPHVIRLLGGESFVLTSKPQISVAAWIAMAVMAGDAGDRERPAVQQLDRDFFFRNKSPPLNWRIAIGDYDRKSWPVRWARHPMCIVEKIEPGSDRTATTFNAQFTTFVTGRLIASVSVAPPGTRTLAVSMPNGLDRKLRQIWPPVRNEISWPPETISDDEADKITREGMERAMRIGRKALLTQELDADDAKPA
jgi:hypothetical protein